MTPPVVAPAAPVPDVLDRVTQIQLFLDRAGWGGASCAPLAGDASDRRYERLALGTLRAVLMDAPGHAGDTAAFAAIARHLAGLGLSPPAILAAEAQAGLLLLEDLGDDLFPRRIAADPGCEAALYEAATDVLVHLGRSQRPGGVPDLAAGDWAAATGLVLDWYAPDARIDRAAFTDTLSALIACHADGPRVLTLRDYHAENLLWLPGRDGTARVGLLDFQQAQAGQPGYDLVSLLQDARRDVAPDVARAVRRRFMGATGMTEAAFDPAFAILGAQRTLRILGIFARLCLRDGKPRYLPLMPRVWGHLQVNLGHPALAPLARLCDGLPEPTPARLAAMEARCGPNPTP